MGRGKAVVKALKGLPRKLLDGQAIRTAARFGPSEQKAIMPPSVRPQLESRTIPSPTTPQGRIRPRTSISRAERIAEPIGGGPGQPLVVTGRGTVIDRRVVNRHVNSGRQERHLFGHAKHVRGGYFLDRRQAQMVLDQLHDGRAEVLGNKGDFIVVRARGITGAFHESPRWGFHRQPTDVFFIKGTATVSIVPTNPHWRPSP